jgi:hypothetical protein
MPYHASSHFPRSNGPGPVFFVVCGTTTMPHTARIPNLHCSYPRPRAQHSNLHTPIARGKGRADGERGNRMSPSYHVPSHQVLEIHPYHSTCTPRPNYRIKHRSDRHFNRPKCPHLHSHPATPASEVRAWLNYPKMYAFPLKQLHTHHTESAGSGTMSRPTTLALHSPKTMPAGWRN